jgi:hypothetical protein
VAEGLVKTMYALGEDTELSVQVARRFGWTMRLVPGFNAVSDPQRQVVKLNSQDPVRLFLVHWRDERIPLEFSKWRSILEEILELYNDGDFIEEPRTVGLRTRFQGEAALKWEGVWQNDKYIIGGPFRAYAFHRGDRSYLLVGIVYAPGQDKVHILRQVEGMLRTFESLH